MKLAVPFVPETGMIAEDLGSAQYVRIYTEDETVVFADDLESPANGEMGVIDFFKEQGVEVILCGALTEEGRDAVFARRMAVLAGLMGPADDLVLALLENRLRFGEAPEGGGCNCGSSCGDGCSCGDMADGGCNCGCGC